MGWFKKAFNLDTYMPEWGKEINDKMTPKSWKSAGHSIGLSDEAMGLPKLEKLFPIPEIEPAPNPVNELMKATEKARELELNKRRKRVRTLLSDQTETGMATVGTKVLLGG